jgi:hypothetical protein
MLAIQKQSQFIEKAVQLPNGAWALVVFELVERNGQIVAKAISYKLISDTKTTSEAVLCLPYIKSPADFIPVQFFTSETIHSFLKDFAFITSQPTRAPSHY